MMDYRLSVEVYSGTTRVTDPRNEVNRAERIYWTTYYPGGVFGTLHVVVKRRTAEWWAVQGAQRVVVRCGLEVAFEGWIDELQSSLAGRGQLVDVTVVGGWGKHMMRRRWDKPWADSRLTEGVWAWYTAAASAEKCTFDRNQRLMFTPKAVSWTINQGAQFYYSAPTGETVKRVTFSYDMQEGAQAWELHLKNNGGTSLWSVTASGTGNVDHTLGTPDQVIRFQLLPAATQTPAADGSIYGKITNLVVYTETGSINLTEVAKDIRAKVTDLNSTEIYIGSNTLSLVPFVTNGFESRLADTLMKAAEYGDASFNAWACYLDHSEKAPTPDGKPVMVVEQKPALTSADYVVRLEELEEGVEIERYYDEVWNWIVVQYEDASTGARKYYTPDDDANLKDTTSIAAYGQRDYLLKVEDTTLYSQAVMAGRRFLAEHKDPRYRASGQIRIRGQVRTGAGSVIPAAMVRAGKRVKIENALQQGVGGGDLVFLVTNTSYDHGSRVVSLDGGRL